MEYRLNPRTGDRISLLGLGTGSLTSVSREEGAATLQAAWEAGVNFYDLAAAESDIFPLLGEVMAPHRSQVLYQLHFGAIYAPGKSYSWSTKLPTIQRSVTWQLDALGTDYIDYAFIHCIDEASDWDRYVKGGVLAYLQGLKDQGVIRHIGMSSHTPALAQKGLDTGLVDLLMFSINPAYDFRYGDYARGSSAERMALYRRCQAEGVGITVMKPFAGGQLLDDNLSPFGRALTPAQCLQYALDTPGVVSVLPGVRHRQDLAHTLSLLTADPQERDYSLLSTLTPRDVEGVCVYCNHCQPCPVGLDVGLINKYYDLARTGDPLAAGHYHKLTLQADACTDCGHCDRRCPFHVPQAARMAEIAEYFQTH